MIDGSKKPRRILHTSDVHLAAVDDMSCRTLETLADLASKAEVDLFMIVGDLFDHNRVDDDLISFAVEQLRCLPTPVVILPGNHDCLIPDSVYNRAELWKDATNIQILRDPHGETLDLPDLGISIWGKSHDSYESDVRPLVGVPGPQGNGLWHIVMAHGCYVEDEPSAFPGIPSYRITEKEIVKSGWDYIALGHLPTFGCVCNEPVKAFYCGSPLSGTAAIVDFDEGRGVHVTCYHL